MIKKNKVLNCSPKCYNQNLVDIWRTVQQSIEL